MEKTADRFEITLTDVPGITQLVIRPQETTDGVPVYLCYPTGEPASALGQVRQEPTGEWVQIWGDLVQDTVQQIGRAIALHMG